MLTALKLLKPFITNGNKRVLNVGSGSGYMTNLLSLLNKDGFTYGIEHVKELLKISK